MAELSKTSVVTRDGTVTATVLDEVTVERIDMMLTKGAYAAQYARTDDGTGIIDRAVKDLLIKPFLEV